MKTCIKCGAELSDEALFCTSCGEKVEVTAVVEEALEVPEGTVAEESAATVITLSKKEEKAAEKAAKKADKLAEKEAKKAARKAAKEAKIMPTRNSIAAIVAFVLAVIALLNFINPVSAVLAVIALIVSIAGIVNTGRGKASGRGLAVTALVLALITIIIIASVIALAVTFAGDIVAASSETYNEVAANINTFIETINTFIENSEGVTLQITIPTK